LGAVIFDLVGILTDTADLRFCAWSALFNELFPARASFQQMALPLARED
jgi:beta-phosphoglucomutase-like phosphatase (HAD superfamily)